jgi:hypothetical protein
MIKHLAHKKGFEVETKFIGETKAYVLIKDKMVIEPQFEVKNEPHFVTYQRFQNYLNNISNNG